MHSSKFCEKLKKTGRWQRVPKNFLAAKELNCDYGTSQVRFPVKCNVFIKPKFINIILEAVNAYRCYNIIEKTIVCLNYWKRNTYEDCS